MRSTSPRRLRLAALLPFLLLACECGTKPAVEAIAPVDAGPPFAELIEVEGAVTVERGRTQLLQGSEKLALLEGDRIATGPGARAVIRYRDGAELTVAESTSLTLETRQGRLGLRLELGSVVTRAAPGDEGAPEGSRLGLVFLTAYGTGEVAQGSELRLTLGPDGEPLVQVYEGSVMVLGLKGEQTELAVGETLNLVLGRTPVDAGTAETLVGEPLLLTLAAVRGAPELREQDAKKFSRVAVGEAPVELKPGTSFRLPKGASAELATEGVKWVLDPGTRGRLEESAETDVEERHALKLEAGSGELLFPQTTKKERLLELDAGGKAPVGVRVKEPTAARIGRTKKGLRLDVRLGGAEVRVGDTLHQVRAGQVLTVEKDRAELSTPRTPSLILTASRRARVYADRLNAVGIEIPDGLETARLDVATSPDYLEALMSGRAPAKVATVEPPTRGLLYWRFVDDAGAVLREGSARFEPDRGRSVLNESAQQAEVAETGLKASVYFQSAPPALRFSWTEREGAAKYRVRVYAAGDAKQPLVEKTVTGTVCNLEAGQLGEGNYLWYASPLSAAGTELSGGRMNKLELVYDNSRRGLAIASPRPDEAWKRGTVQTRGVAPAGAKLYVNGRAVELDAKGRFASEIVAADALIYRLVSDDGAEHYWVRASRGAR